jgi:pyruvate/2-oxoglutarate dehydrogenase complex dihydrolipoamide dehydrogenase (E3) component
LASWANGPDRRDGNYPARSSAQDAVEALTKNYVPQHLIVLGGGYVGLEMAQAYRRFGSRVTIVEHGPQPAGREARTRSTKDKAL